MQSLPGHDEFDLLIFGDKLHSTRITPLLEVYGSFCAGIPGKRCVWHLGCHCTSHEDGSHKNSTVVRPLCQGIHFYSYIKK